MSSMNISIIGCGWLGLPLAKEFIRLGHTVYGSTMTQEKLKLMEKAGITSFLFDIHGRETVPANIADKTDILIITIPPKRKEKDWKKYGDGLKRLSRQFTKTKRVFFTSSIGIYPQKSAVYSENFEFLEFEKETHLFHAEQSLLTQLKDKLCVLRLGGLFGDQRHPVRYLAGRENIENPFGLVNLVHQKDVIRCIFHLLENEDINGIYNIVFPEHPWRKEYYTKLYRQHGLPAIQFVLSPTIERRIDTSKIIRSQGFEFKHSINDLSDCGID